MSGIQPFLTRVTHLDVSSLSLVLLVIGVAGFIGTVLIGMFLKRGFYRTLIAIPALMAAFALTLIPLGGWIVAVAVLRGMWGLAATADPGGWWSWITKALPQNTGAGGELMVAVIQLSIALGSIIGGLLFDRSGYQSALVMRAAVL